MAPRKMKIVLDSPCVTPGTSFEMRDGVRHCLSCDAPQHDFTESTERETLAVFAAHGNQLCGRFLAGPGGELRFRPEAPARGAGVAALLALSLAACDGEQDPSVRPEATTTEPLVATPPQTEAPPRETEAPPPPTAATEVPDSVSSASEQADHSTDGSTNDADHDQHWHTHPPIGHRHGGARAYHPEHPGDDPLLDL